MKNKTLWWIAAGVALIYILKKNNTPGSKTSNGSTSSPTDINTLY